MKLGIPTINDQLSSKNTIYVIFTVLTRFKVNIRITIRLAYCATELADTDNFVTKFYVTDKNVYL